MPEIELLEDLESPPATEPELSASKLPYHVPVNVYTKRGKVGKRLQAVTMQKALLADVLNQENKPISRAACARAWDVLEDRVRIIDGELKPGSYNAHSRDIPKPKKAKRESGPVGLSGKAKQGQAPLVPVTPPLVVDQSPPQITSDTQEAKEVDRV